MNRYFASGIMMLLILGQPVGGKGRDMARKKSETKAASQAKQKPAVPSPEGVKATAFGKTQEGDAVELYTLTNAKGMVTRITTYGATVTELHVPDRNGNLGNVVLGFDNLKQYLGSHPHFGGAIGRVANRIAGGRFTLGGKEYRLAQNNGPNHLHGGIKGFDKVIWKAEPVAGQDGPAVKFTYLSRDGEEGYPGNLSCVVIYTLTNRNELKIDYTATTDKPTPVNLSNHSYFNLSGPGTGDVLSHEIMILAQRYTPVDDVLIPTGEIAAVKGTPMDFTKPFAIGARINQVKGGYDHNYVLDTGGSKTPVLAARVRDPKSGRVMEVLTSEPGVQFYTGNFLDGTITGLGGTYKRHYGFCLETQHFPDSVNRPNFPSIILEPGKTYKQSTIYRFATGN